MTAPVKNHPSLSILLILFLLPNFLFAQTSAFKANQGFVLITIIAVVALVYIGIRMYTRRVRLRSVALKRINDKLNKEIAERKRVEAELQEREQYMEQLVVERTKELATKNIEIESLLKSIRERNEELEAIVKKRTEKLKASNEELQRSNQDLEQLAYIAAHDLQEPLRMIGSFVGLLSRRYKDQLDETGQEYIAFVEGGAKRMSELIKSLLTYSKVGRKEVELEDANLSDLLEVKLLDLSKKIKEQNVKVCLNPLPTVHCAKDQLGMVFYNLINNAIKFNESEKPEVKITLHEDAPTGFWKFSVADNGIGIPKEFQDKIFEIFRRLHSKEEYEGTGIGLALCQKIVHRHGGTIWVESEPGKGTTFFFTISKYLKQGIPQSAGDEQPSVSSRESSISGLQPGE